MLKLFNRLFASSATVLFAPGVSERFARMLQEAIEKAAKTAKAEMEANEKKWDLVENVLGLKRLSNGQLVAKDQVGVRDPDCDCDFCTGLKCDGVECCSRCTCKS